ncbi:MAG: 4-hydroxy-3-methylbut-2-enyl diphosphate reductase [Chloroflexota bacterium]|nr:4-hydroxy-3-methylbut-2-enyl diphosphate reductase [Chloroflexota bacterium]
MNVLRITPRGFCHGVVDAIRLANEAGAQHQGPVYMLGYLVHNAHVVNELAENGVQLVDFDDRMAGLEKIDHGTVILTAHGVSPAVKQRAIDKGLTVIDATCSDVYITHDLIIDLTSRGYEIIYVGKRGHPEPDGAIGEAPGRVHLVSTTDDVAALDLENDRLAVTTQTTLSIWDTQDVIDAVVAKYPHAEVHNDICLATQDRQEAAVQAADVCDLVIVVGSNRSSNSHRLVEVVRNVKQTPAHLVDSADEVDLSWFEPGMRVGITAGASTPARVTREVIELIEAYEPELEPVAIA